jgi:hypothetical protein
MSEDAKGKPSLSPEAKAEWETYKKNEMGMASPILDASATINPASPSQSRKKRVKPPAGQPSAPTSDKIDHGSGDDAPH